MKLVERLDAYEKLVRLDKPIGTLLLLWPTLWALWWASHVRPDWTVVWMFVLGTVLMRSAGCAINDYADRSFDGQVRRTRDRPLAAGIIRPWEALAVAGVLCALAFLLVWQFNWLTIKLSFFALAITIVYPSSKRFFALPQAILGVAFGFGIPMAFAAQLDGLPALAWALFVANVFWAIAYDTVYAMVDREDDRKIGIRTSAILFGRFDVLAVMASYAAFLLTLTGVGLKFGVGPYYWLGIAGAGVLVIWQYRMIRSRNPDDCLRAFRHNSWIGAAVFAGILAHLRLPALY